jgi:nucleotide-binding universal stress UspA family protein
MLTTLYGQTRIMFAMARDGLIPEWLAEVNPRTGTPARLTLGFDGSDSGEDALAGGLVLCRATGATPVVAAVHPEQYPIGVGRVDAEWVAYMRERAEELLRRARRVLGDDVAADYRAVSAASESRGLHELAEQEHAEIVVVGSSHRGPLGRTYPGSTGDRLLQGSACPVAVAPRGLREDPPPALRTVAVAFIDTPEAHEALRVAAALAERGGARLRLLSVVPSRAEVLAPVVGRDAEEAFAARAREVYGRALDDALAGLRDRVEATGELLEGDVVDALATIDRRDADLLVCGSRGYGPLRRVLLGGVSSRLLRRAACPLLVVPRSAEAVGSCMPPRAGHRPAARAWACQGPARKSGPRSPAGSPPGRGRARCGASPRC